MKRLLLILITCLIGQLGLYAQNDSLEVTYRLSGLITDAQTGEPVPFVSVHMVRHLSLMVILIIYISYKF